MSGSKNKTITFLSKSLQVIIAIATTVTVISRWADLIYFIQSISYEVTTLNFSIRISIGVLALISFFFSALFLSKKINVNSNLTLAVCVFTGLLIVVLLLQRNVPEKSITIVYDESTKNFHPDDIEIESQELNALAKLQMIGQLNKSTILLSTVEQPVDKWRKAFPKGFKYSDPIYSLQEVIKTTHDGFIDISLSNAESNLTKVLSENLTPSEEILIVWDDEFYELEKKLRNNLYESINPSQITSSVFNSESNELKTDSLTNVIYIGSSGSLKQAVYLAEVNGYKNFYVPSWLYSSLDSGVSTSNNKLCVTTTNTVAMMNGDLKTWLAVVNVLNNKDYNHDPTIIRGMIISQLSTSNQIVTIPF